MREYDNLLSYLPRVVAQHVVNEESTGPQALWTQQFETICLFADVSGFTKISEELAGLGSEGIEELANQLNKFVGLMVKLTARAGGDVLKFAGDAMVAFWPPKSEETQLERVRRAVQCALDMQQQVDHFHFKMREKVDYRDVAEDNFLYEGELRVKLGLGFGIVRIVHLGGNSDNVVSERFEYVSMGPGLDQAFQCESVTQPGQVVVSKEVYNLVRPYFEFEKVKLGITKKDRLKSKAKAKLATVASRCMRVLDNKSGQGNVKWKGVKVGNGDEIFTPEKEVRLWKYVPAAVMPYLQESNEFWAPELRRVTTLFCNLGLSDMVSVQNPDKLQSALRILQTVFAKTQAAVFRYEGTINKFLVDDKGTTLIAVFGLPPFAHENDATRGVLSALSILGGLHESGIANGSVGITTGVVFCGVVGHRGNRREYSVLGDSVNLAARLMQHAKEKQCGILIDSQTTEAAWSDLQFVRLNDITVKGKKGEVEVHQVLFESPSSYGRIKDVHSLQMARISGMARPSGPGASAKHMTQRVKQWSNFGDTNVMRNAEMDQVRGYSKLHPLAKERDRYNLQKNRANNGVTGANTHMTRLANGLERFEERRGSSIASAPQNTGTAYHQSTSVPPSGSTSMEDVTEEPQRMKPYKAAKIRFDNCATPDHVEVPPPTRVPQGARLANLDSKIKATKKGSIAAVSALFSGSSQQSHPPNAHVPAPPPSPPPGGPGSRSVVGGHAPPTRARVGPVMTTNYTISLHEQVTTVHQVKVEALRWLRDRQLLRNPAIGPEYFELHWADHPDEPAVDESLKLKNLDRTTPVLELSMVERETPLPASPNQASPASSFDVIQPGRLGDTRDVVHNQLLEQRNRLLSGRGGSVVLLEGANGVGKTRLIADVLFASGTKTQVAVAAGNPFETGTLSLPFSVWREVIRQLTEEAMHKSTGQLGELNHAASGDFSMESKEVGRLLLDALQTFDASSSTPLNLSDFEVLDAVLNTNLRFFNAARGTDKMNSATQPPVNPPHKSSRRISTASLKLAGLNFFSSKRTSVDHRSRVHQRNKSPSIGFAFGGLMSSNKEPVTQDKVFSVSEGDAKDVNGTEHPSISNNSRLAGLLRRIVAGLSRSTPTIIVLDDSHHMDSSSWEVAVEIARNCPPSLLLVLANRKGVDHSGPEGADAFGRIRSGEIPRPASIVTLHNRHNMRAYMQNMGARSSERTKVRKFYRSLLASPFALNLELAPNSMRTADLIRDFLAVETVPNFLVDHLQRRSHGNALFIQDALRAYTKAKLIEVQGNQCVVANQVSFTAQERLHLLPIPSAVESACATQIDALSTAQQLALKTAAMIGQVFTLELVKVAFPIPAMLDELDAEWENLVDVGILHRSKESMGVNKTNSGELFEFETMWMADTLHQRMLTKQKRKLHQILSYSIAQAAEERKIKYMEKSNLAASYSGWVYVRKDHGRNIIKPWKKRWLVLQNDELVQYYEQANPKRLEVITLSKGWVTYVGEEEGSPNGYDSKYDHCFRISTVRWQKKGRVREEPRDFHIAVDTVEEMKDWVYKLKYQIQFYDLKARAAAHPPSPEAARIHDAGHYINPKLASRMGVGSQAESGAEAQPPGTEGEAWAGTVPGSGAPAAPTAAPARDSHADPQHAHRRESRRGSRLRSKSPSSHARGHHMGQSRSVSSRGNGGSSRSTRSSLLPVSVGGEEHANNSPNYATRRG